jgi:predicted nuclease with TOPRIM domain
MKTNATITIDPNIWNLAKSKLPCSRSEFIEKQLKMALNVDDPESELLKKIETKQNELNVLKDKLCSIRRLKKAQSKDQKLLNKAFTSLTRLHDKLGMIGLNQIENIASFNKVSKENLEKLCKSNGFNIVNYCES